MRVFKQIKKLVNVKTLLSITSFVKYKFVKEIAQIIKEIKKNKKYIDIIILSDIQGDSMKLTPFSGNLFNSSYIYESI